MGVEQTKTEEVHENLTIPSYLHFCKFFPHLTSSIFEMTTFLLLLFHRLDLYMRFCILNQFLNIAYYFYTFPNFSSLIFLLFPPILIVTCTSNQGLNITFLGSGFNPFNNALIAIFGSIVLCSSVIPTLSISNQGYANITFPCFPSWTQIIAQLEN